MRKVTWGEFLRWEWPIIFVTPVVLSLMMLAGAVLINWLSFLILFSMTLIFYLFMIVSVKEKRRICSCGQIVLGRKHVYVCRHCGKKVEENYSKGR